jgi:hypothetical protein
MPRLITIPEDFLTANGLIRAPTNVVIEDILEQTRASADIQDVELDAITARVGAIRHEFAATLRTDPVPAEIKTRVSAARAAATRIRAAAERALDVLRPREATNAEVLTPTFRHVVDRLSAEDVRAQEAEIRARYYAIVPAERRARYLAAARKGDSLTLRAVERAPVSDPLLVGAFGDVDERTVREGARLFAEAKDSARYDLLLQLRAAINVIEYNTVRALLHVRSVTAVDVGEPPKITRWDGDPDDLEDRPS